MFVDQVGSADTEQRACAGEVRLVSRSESSIAEHRTSIIAPETQMALWQFSFVT